MYLGIIAFKRLLGDIGGAGGAGLGLIKLAGYIILFAAVVAGVVWLVRSCIKKSKKDR